MKNLLLLIVGVLFASLLASCGGGGGGGGQAFVSVTGTVLWLPTAAAPSPSALVQIGGNSVSTNAGDGSFVLSAPTGATSVVVLYQSSASAVYSFRFEFPALTENNDLGELVIGPEKVAVVGNVYSSADGSPVRGAKVTFGGRIGLTDSTGRFSLADVAYDSNNVAQFLALEGRASADGFFSRTFYPTTPAVSNVVTIDDVLLPSDSGTDPPALPANIEGFVSPSASAAGTVVTLLQAGVPVRRFTVGTSRYYGFWVVPGTYTLAFANPTNGLSAPDETVVLAATNQIVRRDVTLR